MKKNENKNILKNIENKIPNKWKKRIPNMITSSRIIMALAFILTFITGHMGLSVALFATASISDALDGFLARRWEAQSKFGKYADPLADKLLVGSTLLLYGFNYNSLMFLPLIGELCIAGINTVSVLKNGRSDVNKIGKIKTISLMSTTSLALLSTLINNPILNTLVQGLIYLNVPLQAATLTGYIEQTVKNKKNIDIKKNYNSIENDSKTIKEEKVNTKKRTNTREQIETLKIEKEFLLSKDAKNNDKIKKIGQKK